MELYKLKKLTINYIPQMLNIQNETGNKNTYSFHNVKSLTYSIEVGRVLGLFDNNNLIAFSVFKPILEKEYDYLPDYLNKEKVGKFSGTVVSTKYLGQGIQKFFLNNHIDYAIENDYKAILSYVHKENQISQKNIQEVGLIFHTTNNSKDIINQRDIYLKIF